MLLQARIFQIPVLLWYCDLFCSCSWSLQSVQHIRKVYTTVSKLISQCCTLSVHVHWQFECCFQVTNTLVRATALGWLLNSLNPKQWEFSATCPGHVLRFYSQNFFFIPQKEFKKEMHGRNFSVFEVWENANEHILSMNPHILFSTFVSTKS